MTNQRRPVWIPLFVAAIAVDLFLTQIDLKRENKPYQISLDQIKN